MTPACRAIPVIVIHARRRSVLLILTVVLLVVQVTLAVLVRMACVLWMAVIMAWLSIICWLTMCWYKPSVSLAHTAHRTLRRTVCTPLSPCSNPPWVVL